MKPEVIPNVFVAPSASVAGNVELWDNSSIWYACSIKGLIFLPENIQVLGDNKLIRIGAYTNIQDGTVVAEAFESLNEDHDGSTIIGHYVTVGHGCSLTACTIEDECLVGMGSVLQEGSYMEKHSMLGSKSVLPKGARIPSGQVLIPRMPH
jgi:carbonic anhydrase/acetyltransferase-like protein (isoleucine patch superfamily)